MKALIRWLVFPGINLHARERFHWVPERFGEEIGPGKKVLDAGCGNGMLSYRAWQRGADVLGISIKQSEIEQCRRLFHRQCHESPSRLQFANLNLYAMHAAEYQFDAILCTEVLEHIRDDRSICEKFFQLLKPGGVLHITTPNANHPYNIAFPLDHAEQGGHVRPGYTEAMYYDLLNPLGFQVNEVRGLGGKWRQTFDDLIKRAQEKFGPYAGIPLFGLSLPFLLLDLGTPRVPFCLYVNATRAS